MSQRRILVTAALPYANGPIHIGHLVEYIQTDIWVRYQRLRGNRCVFVCADDTHGTAIMISARKAGVTEEAFIAGVHSEHVRDFAGFDIVFDNYGTTHSPENRTLCAEIWQALRKADLIKEREVTQLFDTQANTFLADRFVKGTCPRCKSPDQYGDSCEKCTATYSPTDLIDPISTLSGSRPEIRSALHLFVDIEKSHAFLNDWTQSGDHLQSEIANYLQGHFLGEPLRDWDVSRPAPYFGFEIPDSRGNYWYVWFDAPIGYMASTQQWCTRSGEKLDDWWRNPDTEIHHFIGKDITYFHTLFWPAMLRTAGFQLPTKIHVHGFLTVGGEKMSKSKGTFVKAATYLRHLDPAYLRYYYASKLGPRLDDIDLNLDEFAAKVNADLVGKVVNLASRTARFVLKSGLSAEYPDYLDEKRLFVFARVAAVDIAKCYENCDYNRAIRHILSLADDANHFVEQAAPWKLANEPEHAKKLQDVCTIALNLFRQLAIYLAPVLPRLAEQTGQLLNDQIGPGDWDKAQRPLLGSRVNPFEHLLKRVDLKQVEAMIEDSKAPAPEGGAQPPEHTDGPEFLAKEPMTGQLCTFDEFAKIDMRVARVIEAEDVTDSNKLLRLTLSLGGTERRNVFAGIKGVYKPEELVGRLVVCCANLEPRKMRFGTSEGMVLAAGAGGTEIFLLEPDTGAAPGQRVH